MWICAQLPHVLLTSGSRSASSPYDGLRDVLPKRAIPSWVWLIGLQAALLKATEAQRPPSPEAQRIIDRKARKWRRRLYAKHGPAEFLKGIL